MRLFLVALVCQQGTSSEDTFRKMTTVVLESKTLRLKFDWGTAGRHKPDPECGSRRGGAWGRLLFKGDKFLYEESSCVGRVGEAQVVVVSDGKTLRHRAFMITKEGRSESKVSVPERVAPGDLCQNIRLAFAHTGTIGVRNIVWAVLAKADASCPVASKIYQPYDFTMREDGASSTIAYALKVRLPGADERVVAMKVSYDSKKSRVTQYQYDDLEFKTTWFDSLEGLEVNTEIPDELFSSAEPEK